MKQLKTEELPVFEKILLDLGVSTGVDYTCKLIGDVRAFLNGHVDRNFFVDEFPNFSAAVSIIQKTDKTENAENRFLNRYVTCYGENQESLKQLLLDVIDEIQWEKPLIFVASHHFVKVLEEVAAVKGKSFTYGTYPVLQAAIDDIRKFTLPDGYTVSVLKEDEATLIAQAWPFAAKETSFEPFVRWLIRQFSSIAIREEDGTLVAYLTLQENGTLGLLSVLPEHRNKGIAQFVVTELARKTLTPREVSYLYTTTEESYKLHTKCGYKKILDTVWTYFD